MIKPRKTYTSCSDLPLFNFIKIVVHDDLRWLYIEDKRLLNKNVELDSIWDSIFTEYNSISNNSHGKHVLALIKEMTIVNNNLIIIQNAVKFLNKAYDVRICDMLRKMGFIYKYTTETMESDLKLTISSAKRLVIRMLEAEKEFKDLNTDEKKATETDFYSLVRQVSRFNGFPINAKKTTVTEFVNDLNAFKIENTKDGK